MVLGAENGINSLVLDEVFLFVRILGTGMAPDYFFKFSISLMKKESISPFLSFLPNPTSLLIS